MLAFIVENLITIVISVFVPVTIAIIAFAGKSADRKASTSLEQIKISLEALKILHDETNSAFIQTKQELEQEKADRKCLEIRVRDLTDIVYELKRVVEEQHRWIEDVRKNNPELPKPPDIREYKDVIGT